MDRSQDTLGKALYDYHINKEEIILRVDTTVSEDEEISASYFFRSFDDMPIMEKKALELAKGSVLDCGAGAGCHSILLQEKGLDVTACEISPYSLDVLRERGIKKIFEGSVFTTYEKYDTILMLMNGIGMVQTVEGLASFLKTLPKYLNEGGQLLLDSSDIIYMFMDDDGGVDIDLNDNYYGELEYEITYEGKTCDPFLWLYVGYDVLEHYCHEAGLKCEKLVDGEHYDYLAKIEIG